MSTKTTFTDRYELTDHSFWYHNQVEECNEETLAERLQDLFDDKQYVILVLDKVKSLKRGKKISFGVCEIKKL